VENRNSEHEIQQNTVKFPGILPDISFSEFRGISANSDEEVRKCGSKKFSRGVHGHLGLTLEDTIEKDSHTVSFKKSGMVGKRKKGNHRWFVIFSVAPW
jgi:hypothetical protein